ncbi:carbon-nitrogen hydrolase family protein [Kerstersia gyiorum]|uniref:Acyltransferase n=1 Tax=Kerstersia gyiorum TaxID=206506 RepID=A0A171KPC2_9BURK|nr:carbon-nitrogen hydrolase family protein [Kerstersia gyiorum]AZV93101.1 acyltransferase [Bordetella sp. J329]KAB0544334.1 carbon-nitrogen hydrolase family protein [Kerstersia gyiorum]KKO70739.1 acyltransferase [Kerstersia gyiorum]MCP1634417.1 nitrilase [Kerstersia gyiorum]MCP1636018.1 nitrilase [Kerstersia gyiorum]
MSELAAQALAADSALPVAGIQMVSTPDVQENLAQAEALIAQAVAGGARLVALPEYFCLIGLKDEDKLAIIETDGAGPLQEFLSAQARRHGIWLAGGTIPLASGDAGRLFNAQLVYGPDGQRVQRYDKIHLFSFTRGQESYDESRVIRAGSEVRTFDTPCGRVGLSTCYDLRFPEMYRAMGSVSLLLVPAAFTYTTGKAHWELLLRARAVENQCYVLAPAQGGRHASGRRTWGHAMLIDPWGEIVDVLEEGPGVVSGVVDPARIASIRTDLPALRHRVL